MLKKILVRTFAMLFALVVLVLLIFVAANWVDQDLRPEVLAELSWQPPKVIDEDNAYLLLLGLNAREGIDALSLGKQKLAAQFQRYEKNRHLDNYDIDSVNESDEIAFVKPKSEICDYSETINCVAFYLSRSAERELEILKSKRGLLANFDRLKISKNYQEIIPPHIIEAIANTSYEAFLHVAELERMRAIRLIANGQLSKGLAAFIQVAELSQLWLENGSSLVSHMRLLVNIERDVRILDELLQKFPELLTEQEKIGKWISRFSKENMDIVKTFEFERKISMPPMQRMFISQPTESEYWWARQLFKLGFRPNASLNLYYDARTLEIQTLKERRYMHLKDNSRLDEKQKALLGLGFDGIYLRDPFVKVMLPDMLFGYEAYVVKYDDTFAQINLLALKFEILKKGIVLTAIPQFLQEHTAHFPHGSNGKSMKWDGEKQQLFVELRQASSQLYQKGKILRLNVLARSELSGK